MRKLQYILFLFFLTLFAAQCRKSDDIPDIKPQKVFVGRWAQLGIKPTYSYKPGTYLELYSDSTYKMYTNNDFLGEGTFSVYTKVLYPGTEFECEYTYMLMRGQSLMLWDFNLSTISEYELIHFIGDSLVSLSRPEARPQELVTYLDSLNLDSLNLTDELLGFLHVTSSLNSYIYFIKMKN